MNGRESVLKKALAPLRTEFDYIIIDCPPSLGLITTNALNASDSVLIPVQCEYYALEGLSQLMSSVQAVKRRYNDRLELEGVLLTMYDGRLNLTQQVVTEIKKYFRARCLQQSFRAQCVFPRRRATDSRSCTTINPTKVASHTVRLWMKF